MDSTRLLLLRERLYVMRDLLNCFMIAVILGLTIGYWPVWALLLGAYFVCLQLDPNWRKNEKNSVYNGQETSAWVALTVMAVGASVWMYFQWYEDHPIRTLLVYAGIAWFVISIGLQVRLSQLSHRARHHLAT